MVTPADVEISQSLMQLLHDSPSDHQEVGNRLQLQRGHILQQKDQPCRQFHILLSVSSINSSDKNQDCLCCFVLTGEGISISAFQLLTCMAGLVM